jgi:hypothetical protein
MGSQMIFVLAMSRMARRKAKGCGAYLARSRQAN